MADFGEDDIRALLDRFWSRCSLARSLGISRRAVANGDRGIPEGWELDVATQYYLPPGVDLDAILARGEAVH